MRLLRWLKAFLALDNSYDEQRVCAPYEPKVTPEKLARSELYPRASITIYPNREKP